MNTIKYKFSDFSRDINILIDKLSNHSFDIIIGLNRGGCIPAVCLSHALNIPATTVDWSTRDGITVFPETHADYFALMSKNYQKVLIVDDLIDSGATIKTILKSTKGLFDVTIATLLYNDDVVLETKHFYGSRFSRTQEPRYFDFWWESFERESKE